MHMKSRMPFQPRLHFRMLVRGVVIDDQMQVKLRHRFAINRLEKLDPLLVTMPLLALRNHGAIGHTQRGKQRRRAVPFVVVRHGLQTTGKHRQTFLSAI